jgi:hypothetical protein
MHALPALTAVCFIAGVTASMAAAPSSSAVPPDLSGADPHWIADETGHCFAGNPDPQGGESVRWTGACENGLVSGPGTLTWYRSGHVEGRDEGNFHGGILAGHGRIVDADGAIYDGDFPGSGQLTLPDGRRVAAHSIRETAGWSIEETHP